MPKGSTSIYEMIVRRNRNRGEATGENLCFAVQFGDTDVRAILKDWYNHIRDTFTGLYSKEKACELALATMTATEQEWRADFAAHPYFCTYPERHKEIFAAWAFTNAVKNKYIIASSTEKGKYYLSQSITPKVGRPTKEKE